MLRAIRELFFQLFESAIRNISGTAGRRIRLFYYQRRLGSCGKKVVIDEDVIIRNPARVFLGDEVWLDSHCMLLAGEVAEGRNIDIKTNPEFRFGRGELHVGSQVHIGPQVILQAHGGLEIGNRLTIGAGSKIYTLSHHYRNTKDLRDARQYLFGSMVSVDEQFLIEGAVVIKNNSAIGMNCVLLPGSIVPENTWLGVGLVLRDKNLLPDHLYLVNQDVQVKEK